MTKLEITNNDIFNYSNDVKYYRLWYILVSKIIVDNDGFFQWH